MAQTKPKAGQFYGVSNNGTDGQFLKTDGTGGMSWDSPITNPTITSIDYPGSATAADPAGGESVIINGTLFASGITCTVGGTSAVTAFNSATQITITTPAKAAGQYTVAVTNTDGGTVSQANFIQYSGVPVWSTASGSLGSIGEGATASFQVTATEGSDTIEYAVTTGSLPSGLSLNTNTGAITGTAPSVSSSTTTTFSITATDDENQTSSARSFNITVTPDLPSNYFNTVLYTGNNSTQSITGVGFQPDFVWIKARNNGSNNHALTDSIRGTGSGNGLSSNTTGAEGEYSAAYGYLSAFGTDGFTVQAGSTSSNFVNSSSANYVAWCFKAGGAAVANNDGNVTSQVSANNTLGFSIASYTSTGTSGATFGHGLDAAPELVLLKCTSTGSTNWIVGGTTVGNNYYLSLNSNGSQTSSSNWLVSSATTLQLNQTFGNANTSGREYITYNFTSKPGFSKVGTYTGNGTSQNISTGFKVGFVLIKSATSTQNWMMYDSTRGGNKYLLADSASAEGTSGSNLVNFYTNGFGVSSSNSENQSGQTFIYLAFAADPSTTTPSLANSFDTTLYNGSSSTPLNVSGVGFKADFSWLKVRNNSWSHGLFSSLMPTGVNNGVKNLYSNREEVATDLWGTLTWNNNGWTLNGGSYNGSSAHDFGASGYNFVSWNWKAGGLASINTDGSIDSLVSANQASGFSVVKYTGNGSGGTVGHGLNATPEMYIVKSIDHSAGWYVYHVGLDSSNPQDYNVRLNETSARQDSSSYWNDTAPTSSVYTIGTTTGVSKSNTNFISYCFTSIAGYSKVSSYVGTGSAGNPQNVGFAPSFVLLKMATSTESWWMFDTDRTDKRLEPNTQDAESNETRFTFTSTGFSFTSGWSNDSGETFIYLAIKEN